MLTLLFPRQRACPGCRLARQLGRSTPTSSCEDYRTLCSLIRSAFRIFSPYRYLLPEFDSLVHPWHRAQITGLWTPECHRNLLFLVNFVRHLNS